MVTVHLNYMVHTWARKVLDGPPNGFGTVERSGGWPATVDLPASVLTLHDRERRDVGATFGGVLATPEGRLLVIKRALGPDGSGRPGNYITFVAVDPSNTVGSLDLIQLIRDNLVDLNERIDATPRPGTAPLLVDLPDSWLTPPAGGQGLPDSVYDTLEEAATAITNASLTVPPDVVNRQPLWTGTDQAPPWTQGRSVSQTELNLIEQARSRGWNHTTQWWIRLPSENWAARAREYLALLDGEPTLPIGDLMAAVDRYPEEHVVGVSQLVARFEEFAGSERDVRAHARLLVSHAVAAGPGQALDLVRTAAAAGLSDKPLADLIAEVSTHGVSFDPLRDDGSQAADRILDILGIARPTPTVSETSDQPPAEPEVARSTPTEDHPVPVTDTHSDNASQVADALQRLHEAHAYDGKVQKGLVSEAVQAGATPADVWAAAGSEALDALFIKVSPDFAKYWTEVIAIDRSAPDRHLQKRLRRHCETLVRMDTLPALMGTDYLRTVEENLRLRRTVAAAAFLLLISMTIAIVAIVI